MRSRIERSPPVKLSGKVALKARFHLLLDPPDLLAVCLQVEVCFS
jgi:hypothetical protein